MDKGNESKTAGLAMIVVAVALAAAYFGAFGSFGAGSRGYDAWQLGALLIAAILLAAVFGLYHRRETTRLRRETAERQREVSELERKVADLRQAKEALQRNEARYRRVVADLPVALFAVDDEGVFTLSEGRGLEALGLEPEKVVGRSIFEMHRDAPQIVENVRLALAGKAFDATVEVGGLSFETRYSPLRENGEFSGVLGVATDVTERKEAEDQLRAAEARYRTLVEQVPAITYIEELSEKGKRLTYMSPQYEATLGYSLDSGLSHPEHWLEIVHPDDRERLLAEDIRTDETLEPFKAEYRMFAKDGRVVWIRDEAVVVRDEGGRPSFWQGVMFDVTEQKRAEEDLREAEARYRTLVEQIPAGVYIQELEHEGAISYISPRIEDLLGYTPQEYIEDPSLWVETTHPEDRERVLAEDARTDETGEPFTVEFRKIARDGRVLWMRDEAVLVKDVEGRPLYWQGIFVDITERKEAEESLRESQRRLSTLLSNAPAYLYRCRNEPGWPNEFVSDHAFELTGHTPEELTDGSVMYADLMVEEDRERVWEEVQAALAQGGRFELWYSVRRKDGEIRHVEERGHGVYGEDGRVEAIEGVVYDVTERVRAEEALRQSEERYRLVAQATNEVIWDNDLTTNAQVWDGATEAMFGYPPQQMGTTSEWWEEHIHPDDRDRVLANTEAAISNGWETWVEEYRFRRADGAYVTLVDRAYLVRDAEGRPVRMLGSIMDVTERRRAEEALRKSQAGLAEAQRMAHLGSWEWDPRTGELYWSDETFRIYGFEPQSFVPTFERLLEVVHSDDRKMLSRELEDALYDDRPYDFEHRLVKPDGEVRVVHRQAEVVRDESGEPIRVVGTVHDITERKALEVQLQHQAMHDPLTGLPNRALFTDRLRQALARAKRREGEVAVLFMDLDNFKVVNDSLGHKAGDRLLVAAGRRIRTLLRPEDTVARLGGDEFILLLEDTDAQGAVQVAERVLERLREPFPLGGRRVVVTASVGVTTGGANGKYAADLLRDADLAMYRAKRAGKARYAVFEESMNTEAIERLELEHDLRRGIERGELKVHYQLQMRLDADLQRSLRASGSRAIVSSKPPREPRVTGVEALVRWEHPERGLLLPGDFVALAEETGLIVPMGEAVLEEACRQAKDWQGRFTTDPPLDVYVNLSARQFREPDLTETVSRILQETDLDPACLHLEITETTAMSDAPATVSTLKELKALGVRLVIDDFGTGYSSLSYLQRFPVDYVKIDRSFVEGIETDPGAIALVSGMIGLAHALSVEVIAEGVERAGQVERLGAMGCDLAQGYYFSGPLLGELMGALLEDSATE